MHGSLKRFIVSSAVVILLFASGCVVIGRDHKVSEVRVYPKTEICPALCMGSTTYAVYLRGDKVPYVGSQEKTIASILQFTFENSGLYSKVSKIESVSDFRVDFEAKKDIKMTGGDLTVTRLTLGLIPNSTRRTYAWTAHIKNIKTGEVRSVHVEEGGDGFEHLILLPVGLFFGSIPVEGRLNWELSQNMAVAVHEAISNWGPCGHAVEPKAAVAGPAIAPEAGENGAVKKLKALKDALEAGVLTEQEYQTKRAEVLKNF